MSFDRRQFLAAGSASLLRVGAPLPAQGQRLDLLLAANAAVLPEAAGSGANHYPMAAEALETLGFEDAIEEAWTRGARSYAGAFPRVAPIERAEEALGSYARLGDWLDLFRAELERAPWRSVVGSWAPPLAAGLVGATFHGLIRTAHAVRALRRRDSAARKDELAVGLAYWAARYTELPVVAEAPARRDPSTMLAELEHPWLEERADVDFFAVMERLTSRPLAPSAVLEERATTPRTELDRLVLEAARAFLEMLVLERQRIWLLHTVTGPAAVDLLLPDVDPAGARKLVEYARQAVVALHAAYGAPFRPNAHLRPAPAGWSELTRSAVESRSVHTIKLVEALKRFDRDEDTLLRSVAEQWLEWK